jgi:hypothetical protein
MSEKKLTLKEAAERFGVGSVSVSRWQKNLEPILTRNKPAIKIDRDALAKDLADYPDSYLYERAERFAVSVSGICSAMKRLGFSRKKSLKYP